METVAWLALGALVILVTSHHAYDVWCRWELRRWDRRRPPL